jgi:hypothetical protein
MSLVRLVKDPSIDGMVKYLNDRYEVLVSAQDAASLLCEISIRYLPHFHDESHLQVRLKERLKELGYLAPLFTNQEDDHKVVWNELHLFTEAPPENYGTPELDESEYPCPKPTQVVPRYDIEPNYVRSKITEYGESHRPRAINKTAHNVARLPEKDTP